MPNPLHEMEIHPDNKYSTLTDLVEHLKINFPPREFTGAAIDYETGDLIEKSLPRFLFRGEEEPYPSSQTSLQRMITDGSLTGTDQNILTFISNYADEKIQERLIPNKLYSSAYNQHYGLYSDLMDFTADIDIGSRFATTEKRLGKPGRICVLDVEKTVKNAAVLDLTAHPYAFRPRLQQAYGIYNQYFDDMQHPGCIDLMGLTWYEFEVNDAPQHIRELDIYKVKDDIFAGYLALIIDECIKENGGVTKEAAERLAARISRVPLFSVTDDVDKIRFDKLGQGLTAQETGIADCEFRVVAVNDIRCEIDVEQEQLNSYRKWFKHNTEPEIDIVYKTSPSIFAIRMVNTKMMMNIRFDG